MMATVSTEHIEITPGVCGGKPRIAGHRITVQDVVIWHEQMGMNPDEIVATYPTITLADVHAALVYYHDHRDEIQGRMKADDDFAAEMRAKAPASRLQQILAERDAVEFEDELRETANTGYIEGPPATAAQPRGSGVFVNVLIVLGFLASGGAAIVAFLGGSYLQSFQEASFGLALGVYVGFLIAGRDFQEEFSKYRWLTVTYMSLFVVSTVAAVVMTIRENKFGWLMMWALGMAIFLYMKRENDRRRTAAIQAPPLAG